MKKIFFCMFVVVTLMLLISTTAFAISGEGTEENPYIIETEEDFMVIGNFPDKCYKLNNDITLTAVLGDFSGTLDGNNFTIATAARNIFNSNSGIIKNLTASDCVLADTNNETGTIVNCTTMGNVLVITNNGSISNCQVTDYYMVSINNGMVSDCQVTNYYMIVTNNGVVLNCYATGKIENLKCSLVYYNKSIIENSHSDTQFYLTECEPPSLPWVKHDYSIFCGGLVYDNGYEGSKIAKCSFTGTFDVDTKPEQIYSDVDIVRVRLGGIAAKTCENSYISECYSECSTNIFVQHRIQKEEDIPYIIPISFAPIVTNGIANIENCYSNCSFNSTIRSYSTYYYDVGEFYGIAGSSALNIANSYAVSNSGTLNGLCDGSVGNGVTNSFYLAESPSTDDYTYGIPASSGAMKLKDLYEDWDFDTVWAIDSEINDGYPYLRWQYPEDVEEPETPTVPDVPPVIPDEDTPIVKVESVKGKSGGTVAVPLYIENNTGIAGMQLSLTHDKRLTLTGMTRSTGEEDSALESLNFTVPGDLTATTLTLPWYGLDADSTNGKILVLTFTIPEGAEDDTVYDIAISYEQGGIYDNDLNDVDFEMVNGSIAVKNYTIGDINDDGLINTKDITILSRGIAGGYGVTLTEAADVNADGLTNTKDITILSRYIAGGYGVILGK